MNEGRYILVGQTPVQCDDLMEWASSMGGDGRRVALTRVGPITVSTVFLGLDHNFHRSFSGNWSEPPILFETMAYIESIRPHENCHCFECRNPTEFLDFQERCSTWLEAETQHAAVVARLAAEHPGDTIERLDLNVVPETAT